MSGTEWFCGVQLGGVKLPAEFPAARNSKSMVHAGTGRWRQKNGRPMLIVGSRLAVYRMAVLKSCEMQGKNSQLVSSILINIVTQIHGSQGRRSNFRISINHLSRALAYSSIKNDIQIKFKNQPSDFF